MSSLWNYNPDNEDHIGDDWNGENFSWFSRRRALTGDWLDLAQTSPTLDNGARIVRAFVRPYPAKTAGIPVRFDYEMNTGQFTFEWVIPGVDSAPPAEASVASPPLASHPALTSKDTQIFLPSLLAHSRKIVVQGLKPEDRYRYDEARQTLTITTADLVPGERHSVTVSLNPPLKDAFTVNSFWDDFGLHVVAATIVLASILIYVIMSMVS